MEEVEQPEIGAVDVNPVLRAACGIALSELLICGYLVAEGIDFGKAPTELNRAPSECPGAIAAMQRTPPDNR